MPPSLLGPLAVIGAATLWGSNHVVARGIHEAVPLLAMVFWRWSLAIAILIPFSWASLTRDWPELKRHWRYLLVTGFVGVGIFSLLLFAGAYETQALQVGLLNATTPIWVLVLARLLRGDQVRVPQVLGIALGILGVVILLTRGELMRLGGVEWHRGDLWSILAAITFAWFSLRLRDRPPTISQTSLTVATGSAGLLVSLPLYLWHLSMGGGIALHDPSAPNATTMLAAMAFIVVGPTLLGNLFWNIGCSAIGAKRAAPFLYLSPVVSSILAVLVLGEPLRAYHFLGAIPVLIGLVLVSRR